MTTIVLATAAMLQGLPWIGAGNPPGVGADWYNEKPAALFIGEFTMPEGKTSAKATIACLGSYEISNNGVLNSGPMPLWSPFAHTVYADTYELKDLKPGNNAISVLLGNGFYNLPPLRFWGSIEFRSFLTSGEPCFKLAIEGVKDIKWTVLDSPVRKNSVYLGTETVFGKFEDQHNSRPAVEIKPPRVGRIVDRKAPAVVKIGVARGTVSWLDEEKKIQVIDLGANYTGHFTASLKGVPAHTKIEFIYGERLNKDGSVNFRTQTAGQIKSPGKGGPGAPDIAMQRDYMEIGERELPKTYLPLSWHVCRYIEVYGCPVLLKDHAFEIISADLKPTARGENFKSRDARLNKLHEVCRRTFRDNLISVQSDCPGRERLGYGGDIVATCETMCLNWDMKEFYLKTLQDFADEASENGWITETAPFVGIADSDGIEARMKQRRGPISWALAVPVLMDTLIRHYPDAKDRALAFYPTCTRYIELMDAANPSGIVPRCIGDHEALERAPDTVTATAHWYEFVRLTAKFSKMLGKDEDAKKFGAIAAKIRGAFAAEFVKDGKVANGTQSAQSIALYLGLVPSDQIPAAEKILVEAIHAKGDAVSTGIFSTRYMLMYLSEHGYLDLARKIVTHEGYPGWLHMLDRGATTLWETWAESDDVYSNCHPMFGSVDEWLLKYERDPFEWRGFMVDEARHFFGKDAVKMVLDRMAELKLNRFHWHLTDDQGWRLDIPGMPELVKFGAVRPSSPVPGTEADSDGKQYGPFYYTAADVKEIVDYAAKRGITVIPEIEIPGHTRALLASHPEFACEGAKFERTPWCEYGICTNVVCAGNDAMIECYKKIFDEVMKMFPGEYIHIGGDECPKAQWKSCPKCAARMKKEKLKDYDALQGWVTRQMVDYISSRGRRVIGWDEILEGGELPKGTIIQSWRGFEGGRIAAEKGYDAIMSPSQYLYFSIPEGRPDDHYPTRYWSRINKSVLPYEKVRYFDPHGPIPPECAKHILGAECCIWTEVVHSPEELKFKAFNRLGAFSKAMGIFERE